jgi:hypothetical protein
MEASVAQGVAVELDYLINEAGLSVWKFSEERDGFRVVPPPDLAAKLNFPEILIDFVWTVSRFVAYGNYMSVQLLTNGDYLLSSHMESGHGYEIVFESQSRPLPNAYHRTLIKTIEGDQS